MAGNKVGGAKTRETHYKKYGLDFYKRIGAIGGRKGKTGGFAYPLLCDCDYKEELHKKAECAGSKGGKISKRGKVWK